MNSLRKNFGMTLTELMMASILVGIVMLGVVAFSISLSQMESTSSKNSMLAMQSVSLLSAIRKDVNLATGDGTDWGIYIPTTLPTGQYYISIRRDLNVPQTVNTYTDDSWIIYFWHALNFKLKRCEQAEKIPTDLCKDLAYVGRPDPTKNLEISILSSNMYDASFKFKKNNRTWVPGSAAPVNPEVFNGQCVLNVSLTSIFDPTQDPSKSKNPFFNLETSIMSSTHSW